MQNYLSEADQWDQQVTEILADLLGIPYGDAAGIFDANPFIIAQSYCMDRTPLETATVILNQLN